MIAAGRVAPRPPTLGSSGVMLEESAGANDPVGVGSPDGTATVGVDRVEDGAVVVWALVDVLAFVGTVTVPFAIDCATASA